MFHVENPADHILRLLQDDEIVLDVVDKFREQQDSMQMPGGDGQEAGFIPVAKLEAFEKYPTSFMHQIVVLLRRSMYDTVKDKTKFARLRK